MQDSRTRTGDRSAGTAALILRIVGLFTAGLILILGIMVLSGYGIPPYVPQNFRIIMGCIMVLYAAYRGAMSWIKAQKAKRYED